jgi:redox-sensitive bicupin YhaK (pirin superfamily)
MVQLWVNLPAKDKMSTPKYQAIANAQIPKLNMVNNGGQIELISGEYDGHQGAASTFTPVHLFNAKLKIGAEVSFSFPAHFNTGLLVIEGSVIVNNNEEVPLDHFALFANKGESFTVKATEDCIVLILSGEPIKETIAAHGPFVMNTRQEILQAFEDYENGKFGTLED